MALLEDKSIFYGLLCFKSRVKNKLSHPVSVLLFSVWIDKSGIVFEKKECYERKIFN